MANTNQTANGNGNNQHAASNGNNQDAGGNGNSQVASFYEHPIIQQSTMDTNEPVYHYATSHDSEQYM